MAWSAVETASSRQIVAHVQVQKTTARISQPISGTDLPAPRSAKTAAPTTPLRNPTRSLVRAGAERTVDRKSAEAGAFDVMERCLPKGIGPRDPVQAVGDLPAGQVDHAIGLDGRGRREHHRHPLEVL